MTRVRLVATDLDGTLLGPDGRIADADRAALRQAVDAGVRIAVVTGRPLRWLGCLDAIADLGPFVIVSNGAAVVDLATRRVVRSHPLPRDTLVELSAELRVAVPGALFAVEQGLVFGCEPGWLSHLPDTARTRAQEDSSTLRAPWPELLDRVTPVVKMLVLHSEHDIEHLHELATAVVGDRAVVTHSVLAPDRALLELSAPGVTKASALAELCAELGVRPEEVVAFGDMPNDLAMLAWAGQSFAMADAHPALRERFDVAGSHADGGVGAKVLELLGQVSVGSPAAGGGPDGAFSPAPARVSPRADDVRRTKMSDNVSDYGLGAPNTQEGAAAGERDFQPDPLEHGLGRQDVADVGDVDPAGRHNRLEHGLGQGGDDVTGGVEGEGTEHGLGAANTQEGAVSPDSPESPDSPDSPASPGSPDEPLPR